MSKIAILMSTYNGEEFLNSQLESIANQITKHDISLYIRDDGSKDNTIHIIEKWMDKIDIHLDVGNNIGPARSFWNLFKNKSVHADYYAFCDQDDIWDNNKMEIAVNSLSGEYHLYACNCRSIDADGMLLEQCRKKNAPEIALDKLFVSGVTQGCAMVITNELREYICEKNISCVPMHDQVICMYALTFGKFFWDPTPHFSYRFHDNNVVANKNKSGILSKIQTFKRWKRNSKDSLTVVAKELLSNCVEIDEDMKCFLENVAECKNSVLSKIYLLRNSRIKRMNRVYRNSFYLRVLFNLI